METVILLFFIFVCGYLWGAGKTMAMNENIQELSIIILGLLFTISVIGVCLTVAYFTHKGL